MFYGVFWVVYRSNFHLDFYLRFLSVPTTHRSYIMYGCFIFKIFRFFYSSQRKITEMRSRRTEKLEKLLHIFSFFIYFQRERENYGKNAKTE
jgi:hypothetical protein